MYLGVDIGGTKTLVASITDDGDVSEQVKFPTPQDYDEFLSILKTTIDGLKADSFIAGTVAVPAMSIDREHAKTIKFSNLAWKNNNIGDDVEKLTDCPIYIENDAKLGGLSEAILLQHQFSRVLYVTVSTGIGYALIDNCKIDIEAGDGGGRSILLEKDGALQPWEDFASGHAIVEKYGKLARDIDDENTWKAIVKNLNKGFIELIGILQPEVIVIGGSVGEYFEKYGHLLSEDLKTYDIPKIKLPIIKGAQRPNEAVIYGCYEYTKQMNANG